VLADLRFRWGEAYDFRHGAVSGWWEAARLDTGEVLVAGCPRELRKLVVADYGGRPVPRAVRRVRGNEPSGAGRYACSARFRAML
jgi:hypothetical protein